MWAQCRLLSVVLLLMSLAAMWLSLTAAIMLQLLLRTCFFWCSAFDLEDKVVGTVGAGRIGQRVLQRLAVSHHANPCKACDCIATFCLAVCRLTLDCCRLTAALSKLVTCQSLSSACLVWYELCSFLTLHRFTSRVCELSVHVCKASAVVHYAGFMPDHL